MHMGNRSTVNAGGIRIVGNATILNSNFTGNMYGILASTSTDNLYIDKTFFFNQTIYHIFSAGQLRGSNTINITNNNFLNSTNVGLFMQDSTSNIIIFNNTIHDAGSRGIWIDNSSNINISNNFIVGATNISSYCIAITGDNAGTFNNLAENITLMFNNCTKSQYGFFTSSQTKNISFLKNSLVFIDDWEISGNLHTISNNTIHNT